MTTFQEKHFEKMTTFQEKHFEKMTKNTIFAY